MSETRSVQDDADVLPDESISGAEYYDDDQVDQDGNSETSEGYRNEEGNGTRNEDISKGNREKRQRSPEKNGRHQNPNKEYGSASRCMFVGNLSHSTNEVTLAEFCARFGAVRHVKVVKDRDTGHSKGYAFVSFVTHEACKIACKELQDVHLDGNKLRIEASKGVKFEGNEKDGYFPPGGSDINPPLSHTRVGTRNSFPQRDDRGMRGGRGNFRGIPSKRDDSPMGEMRGNLRYLNGDRAPLHRRISDTAPPHERSRPIRGGLISNTRTRVYEGNSRPPNVPPFRRGGSRESPLRKGPRIGNYGGGRNPTYIQEGSPRNYSNGPTEGYRAPPAVGREVSLYPEPRSPPQYSPRNSRDFGNASRAAPDSYPPRRAPRYPERIGSAPPNRSASISQGGGLSAPDPCSIFIGGLSPNVLPERIAQLFERCGRIDSIRVRPEKGFGFLTFSSVQAANDAIRFMDKIELDGRILKVAANSPAPRSRPMAPAYMPERVYPTGGSNYGPERPIKRRMERRMHPY